MPHPVDVHVGKRIRQLRWLAGLSQHHLAEAAGIRFQQINKYESGANRISASRLWSVAAALSVDIEVFFEGLNAEAEKGGKAKSADVLVDKEALDLVRSYYAIPKDQRKCLFDLARALSGGG